MRQSELFGKTTKQIPKDEKSINAQLLVKAGLVNKEMAGVYSFLPLGYRVLCKIEQIIREEINNVGGQEILMPALQPKENWQTTGRWQGFDALYKVQSHYDQEFVLGPTHEEIIVPLAKKFIQSYKDLPLYLYQIQTKFRDEPRAKSGLLRGREFGMKDLYSFHTDENDLDDYYEKVKQAYFKIFKRLGLNVLIVEASGGTFSKYSHEFQLLNEAGEDTVFYCECGWAQNKEIAEVKGGDPCPKCGKKIKKSQAIEVGNIFKLKTKYSEPFGLKFKDKDGQDKTIIMGCYGIGSSRLMGTIVEAHHDEKGIIWPDSVAPYQIHLITLGEEKTLAKKSGELYNVLTNPSIELRTGENFEVLYDDRDLTAGVKLADSDLIGIPFRLILSEKTIKADSVEVKKRKEKEIKLVKLDQIINHLKKEKVI